MHRLRATQQQQTADLQVYSHSQLEKRPAHVPHGRARSTRQAARPPEFARRAPTGSQQGTGSYVRTYGITARIPSLEVDPPAMVATARKNTPLVYRYHLYMKLRALVTLVRNEGQRASHVRRRVRLCTAVRLYGP